MSDLDIAIVRFGQWLDGDAPISVRDLKAVLWGATEYAKAGAVARKDNHALRVLEEREHQAAMKALAKEADIGGEMDLRADEIPAGELF